MKTIETLVADIYDILDPAVPNNDFDSARVELFGKRLAEHIRNRLNDERSKPRLRLSQMGTECQRKLWFSINTPEASEPLPPAARFKFLFGDILEELLLFLAEEAGHSVEGRQTTLSINGVEGHRDAVIDGRLVDCKSASTFSYNKFKQNNLRGNDPFGYMDQLFAYLDASKDDPVVLERDCASFLVVDKTLGNICLDTYAKPEVDYGTRIDQLKAMLAEPQPPARHYDPVPEGKSGNKKLCTQCSYCPFKKECWPEMRTFIYSSGPTYLVTVAKEPKVIEVDKNGTVVEKKESY